MLQEALRDTCKGTAQEGAHTLPGDLAVSVSSKTWKVSSETWKPTRLSSTHWTFATAGVQQKDTSEETFTALANEWHNDTDYLSSPTRKVIHDAYLNIISMGWIVVPYILHDLRVRGGDWYTALYAIVRESPVPSDAEGDVERMDAAWFEWGRRHGHTF